MKELLTTAFLFSAICTVSFSQIGKVGINTTTPAAMLHVMDSSVLFSTTLNTLPGMPGNPPVRALVDREVALEATLRNLLNRKGYASLEALPAEEAAKGRAEGEARGKAEGLTEGEARGKADSILAILRARGLSVPEPVAAQILQCRNLASLDAWLLRAMTVSSAAEVLC